MIVRRMSSGQAHNVQAISGSPSHGQPDKLECTDPPVRGAVQTAPPAKRSHPERRLRARLSTSFAQLAAMIRLRSTVRTADRMFMHRRPWGKRPLLPLRHEVAPCEGTRGLEGRFCRSRVPGACSRLAPPCRALLVTAACGAQGKAQGPSVPSGWSQVRGRPDG